MSRPDVGVENVIALWARFFMMPLPDISSYTGYNKVDQLGGANVRASSCVWLIGYFNAVYRLPVPTGIKNSGRSRQTTAGVAGCWMVCVKLQLLQGGVLKRQFLLAIWGKEMLVQWFRLGPSTFFYSIFVQFLTLSWEGTKGSQRPPKKTSRGRGLAVNGSNLTQVSLRLPFCLDNSPLHFFKKKIYSLYVTQELFPGVSDRL